MYADLSLTVDAFSRLLRYRISDLYRPLSAPFPFSPDGGLPRLHYVDGIKIRSAFINISSRIDPFFLNERDPVTTVRPIAGINHLDAPRLSVGLLGNVLLAAEDDIVRSGYADPPQVSLMIPPNITMLVRLVVDQQGVLRILGEPDVPADVAAQMGPPLLAFVRRVFTIDQPLALTSVLSSVLPRDEGVVVNAGLCLVEGERVMVRFETAPLVGPPTNPTKRLFEWDAFLRGQVPSRLGAQDWAVDLPSEPLVQMAGDAVQAALSRQREFSYGGNGAQFWFNDPPNAPGLQVVARGRLVNVCAGNDLRFVTTISMRITVPRPNVLRITVSLGFFKNDWDVFKCATLSVINPLFGLITAFDLGQGGGGLLFELAHGLVVPKPIITAFLVASLILGLDDAIVRGIVRREVAKQPTILPLPNDEFGIEQEIDTENPETRDWLVLTEAAQADNRLILRGQFNVPEPVLPRLTGRLLERFGPWTKQHPCSGGSPLITRGAIALGLRAADGPPGTRPNIPLRYADDVAIELHDDPQRVYGDAWIPDTAVTGTWTTINWHIPGTLEVIVANPRSPFSEHPYPFKARFITSGGVRQYEIPAPPAMPKPAPPAIQLELDRQEFAWRLANCYIHSTLVDVVRALQVLWLPNPQPGQIAGQHWQIYLEGLAAGRMATVWDQASGRRLAMVRANQRGQMDISMVIPEQRALEAVLLTFDDQPFMTDTEFREILAHLPLTAEPTGPTVAVQETALIPMGAASLVGVAEQVELFEHRRDVYLRARGFERRAETFRVTSGGSVGTVVPAVLRTRRKRTRHEADEHSAAVRVAIVDGKRTCQILGHEHGQESIYAHYWERPWFDGGAQLGSLFARLRGDGRSVSIYRRGFAREVRPTGRDPQRVTPPSDTGVEIDPTGYSMPDEPGGRHS